MCALQLNATSFFQQNIFFAAMCVLYWNLNYFILCTSIRAFTLKLSRNLSCFHSQTKVSCVFYPSHIYIETFMKLTGLSFIVFANQTFTCFSTCELSPWSFHKAYGAFIRIKLQRYSIHLGSNVYMECYH